ncbi:MAG: hypothetical protein IGQ45_10305 [Cyanobacterium sp. T60_A2020_053]|nr:hypothetical protein [Cyanobacterium sp. T60_A2020_053]
MKRIHLALSTQNLHESILEYNQRLSVKPTIIIDNEYALWRTPTINFSLRVDYNCHPGSLRNLDWEDDEATEFTQDTDVNGIIWEHFSYENQLAEIKDIWNLET